MTKEELLKRLQDIEWEDFECKEAKSSLPKSVWETVSAFCNTSGGWIILGVREEKVGKTKSFVVEGVNNAEKLEQDFIGTLRSKTKFNVAISVKTYKYDIEGKILLAFFIPSSTVKPVYYNNNLSNTFIRSGSGDQHANDAEIAAIQRDQAFGSRSEQDVPSTSFDDINIESLHTYRRRIQQYNENLVYNDLDDNEFCKKVGITHQGKMTYGGLLMLGKRDSIREHIGNFWIDFIEIPSDSYSNAEERYTYRMPEQDNIWESFKVIMQRLRLYVDNPYVAREGGFADEDNTQLYCLREGLVNLCAHADYFSPMHPTIRVFDNRIEFQNPGSFIIGINEVKTRNVSLPRNPTIINLFRYARLSENAGYGIDKIIKWKSLTGCDVEFETSLLYSTLTYFLHNKGGQKGGQKSGQKSGQKTIERLLLLIESEPTISRKELSEVLGISSSAIQKHINKLKEQGRLIRIGGAKGGSWQVVK